MTSASPPDPIQAGWTLLQRNEPPAGVLASIDHITADDLRFAQAQHLRGACAARHGDAAQAKALFVDAIRRGDASTRVWLNLASAASALDFPDDALSMLLGLLKSMATSQLHPFLQQLLGALGFGDRTPHPRKDAAFDKLLLPALAILLDRRDMDGAIALEGLLYEFHVKPRETEDHFGRCMERIGALFTKTAHRWRSELCPLPQPDLERPYRIGFFVHNASMLAHIEVMLNTFKGYRLLETQPFEPTVYCFSGKDLEMERALAGLGVRLVMLTERFPETQGSSWQRLLRLRELLAEERVQELVWISLVTMLPLAFGLRLAPVQTWWAMKYRNFSNEDIDGYVTGSALTDYAVLHGRRWRMARLGVDDWYDPEQEAEAAAIRASFAGRIISMSLAREEKMLDPAYLAAVGRLLAANPDMVFLWAGRQENASVTQAFRDAGVHDRTRFIGWVNTRLYAQVADVFLDTFPFPCGFTLFQAMAAGKPVVIYASAEAAQAGLWNFLNPLVDGEEGAPEDRAELRSIIGEAGSPLIPVARSPDDYIRQAERLIRDPAARNASGEASRRFIARYFSDPRAMGASMANHFIELLEQRRGAA